MVEAIQWTGNNLSAILGFAQTNTITKLNDSKNLEIVTSDGTYQASLNDWIVRKNTGELVPYKPDDFEQEYEEVFDSKRFVQA